MLICIASLEEEYCSLYYVQKFGNSLYLYYLKYVWVDELKKYISGRFHKNRRRYINIGFRIFAYYSYKIKQSRILFFNIRN